MMERFYMTINGKKVGSEKTFDVINPATEQVFAQAPECSPTQLDFAIESALQAFKTWKIDLITRRKALKICAEVLRENLDELGRLFTEEQGKPLSSARGEIEWSARWIEQVIDMEIPIDVLEDTEHSRVELHRKPLGVVGMIAPWNYPILLSVSKIAPALYVGNTAVIKPSPYTPLTTLRIGELFADVLPPGVCNVVSGGDDLGALITTHPKISKVHFTGSVATGKKVAQATAPNLTRITLELGGNDAAIVLPDVNVKEVAGELAFQAFENCGQICVAIKRLYIHEEIYDEMIEEIKKHAEKAKIGNGLDENVNMGPINNLPQLERVIELLEDAKRDGAKVITGGERLDRSGYFFPPTIVTHVSKGMRLVDEEQFGPILPIIPYSDIDEVIERANATDYGLGGSIWTSDVERGIELASRLECGIAGVNQHTRVDPFTPFGGAKMSGVGVMGGILGLDDLCQLQTITVTKQAAG